MSSGMPNIDPSSITQTSVQFTFTQWIAQQTPGTQPEYYYVYVQNVQQNTEKAWKFLNHNYGQVNQEVTLGGLEPNTVYRVYVVPVLKDQGNEVHGISTQTTAEFRTVAGELNLQHRKCTLIKNNNL